MRATNVAASAKESPSSRRTFTWTPADEIAPSHSSRRSAVNALHNVSTTSALVTEPLQLRGHVHLGPGVERARRHHLGRDAHPQSFLQTLFHGFRKRRERRRIAIAHHRDDQLVAPVA